MTHKRELSAEDKDIIAQLHSQVTDLQDIIELLEHEKVDLEIKCDQLTQLNQKHERLLELATEEITLLKQLMIKL